MLTLNICCSQLRTSTAIRTCYCSQSFRQCCSILNLKHTVECTMHQSYPEKKKKKKKKKKKLREGISFRCVPILVSTRHVEYCYKEICTPTFIITTQSDHFKHKICTLITYWPARSRLTHFRKNLRRRNLRRASPYSKPFARAATRGT